MAQNNIKKAHDDQLYLLKRSESSIAVLIKNGMFLLQLRDDINTISFPGYWGLFGGCMNIEETCHQAMRRELLEEIGYVPQNLQFWFKNEEGYKIRYLFYGELDQPIERLHLMEGQEMLLASLHEIASGEVYSPQLSNKCPITPALQFAANRILGHLGQ